jgi:hypothetical protein
MIACVDLDTDNFLYYLGWHMAFWWAGIEYCFSVVLTFERACIALKIYNTNHVKISAGV